MVERKIISRSGSAARWLAVILLAVIVVMLGRELVFSVPPADAQTGWAGGAGQDGKVFAIAGQVTKDTYGLYLVDMKNGTICVYQFRDGGRLRLMAARTFIYDSQLDSYNTEPLPQDVAKLVARARRLKNINTTTRP